MATHHPAHRSSTSSIRQSTRRPFDTALSAGTADPVKTADAVEAAKEAAHATSEAHRRVADVIDNQTRQLSDGMAKARDIYKESTEFAADRMNALMSSYAVLAGGMQQVQKTYLEVLQHSMEMATRGPRDLLRCTNLGEVAELQRNLIRESVDEWLEGSAKLLHMSSQIAEDAVRPIEERVHRHAA